MDALFLRMLLTSILIVTVTARFPARIAHASSHHEATPVSILYGENKPAQMIRMDDTNIQVSGAIWRGSILGMTSMGDAVPLAALTAQGSWIEVRCPFPTTAIGVQFLGDQNDGEARILVDGRERLVNTWGGTIVFDEYVEVAGLPLANHLVRVEATGKPGKNGGMHVTVVAFGCGALLPSSEQQQEHSIYLPLVNS